MSVDRLLRPRSLRPPVRRKFFWEQIRLSMQACNSQPLSKAKSPNLSSFEDSSPSKSTANNQKRSWRILSPWPCPLSYSNPCITSVYASHLFSWDCEIVCISLERRNVENRTLRKRRVSKTLISRCGRPWSGSGLCETFRISQICCVNAATGCERRVQNALRVQNAVIWVLYVRGWLLLLLLLLLFIGKPQQAFKASLQGARDISW